MIRPLRTTRNKNISNEMEVAKGTELTQNAIKIAEEYKEKYLRSLADFENYKRQKTAEIEHIRKTANKDIILKIIPALDDCENAYTMSSDPTGIELIYKKIFGVLKEYGVEGFGLKGQPFDPEYHNAISLSYKGEVEKGFISEVFKTGYIMNGEIIRHADVIVEGK